MKFDNITIITISIVTYYCHILPRVMADVKSRRIYTKTALFVCLFVLSPVVGFANSTFKEVIPWEPLWLPLHENHFKLDGKQNHPFIPCIVWQTLPSLKLTANAPENGPKRPKRKRVTSIPTIYFSGAKMLLVPGSVEG